MIIRSKITKSIPSHLAETVEDFFNLIKDKESVRKTFSHGMMVISVLGDENYVNYILQMVTSRYGKPPFVARHYVFSRDEVESAELLEISSDSAPIDKVQTGFASMDQTCGSCLSGAQIVSARVSASKRLRQNLVQTIDQDVIISHDLAKKLIDFGCPRSELVPVQRHGNDSLYYLVSPQQSAPRLSNQSEGVFIDRDHPCEACGRRYGGEISVPQLLRYSSSFLNNIPKDECRFWWSWEYFGAWIDPAKLDPRYASFGRPKLLATKRCSDIIRAYCKKDVELYPVFSEA